MDPRALLKDLQEFLKAKEIEDSTIVGVNTTGLSSIKQDALAPVKAKFRAHAGARPDFDDRMGDLEFLLSVKADELGRILKAGGKDADFTVTVVRDFKLKMLLWEHKNVRFGASPEADANEFLNGLKVIAQFIRNFQKESQAKI